MTREEIMKLDMNGISKRMSEITSEIDAAENMEALDSLKTELDILGERKAQIELVTRAKDMQEVASGAGLPYSRRNDEQKIEVRNTRAYIDAFAEYVKTGDDRECRKLTTTNDTTPNGTGSVPVPTFVLDIIKTAWENEGIMSLVNKTTLKGNVKVGFEISGSDAAIHEEGAAAVSEEELILGVVELIPKNRKKWISISDESYDLRGEAFLRYIYSELAYKIAKKIADDMVTTIISCGTVSTTTCPGVPAYSVSSPGIGDVAQAIARLSDEANNPVIMMNKLTWGAYKAAQYAGNFNVDPFEGLSVKFNNKIKASAAASTGDTIAIVGDLGHGAMANFPNGDDITFVFDELSRKKEDLVEVLGREYVGLGVVAPDAFVKITKA